MCTLYDEHLGCFTRFGKLAQKEISELDHDMCTLYDEYLGCLTRLNKLAQKKR